MTDLQDAIEAGRRDLGARKDGQLIRGLRQPVLQALGDGERGRVRRTRLAKDAVLYVLPLWQTARPGDRDPDRVLAEIEPALAGALDAENIQREAGMLWAHTDNLILTTGPEAPLHVGYAASKALMAALRDEPLDPPDADPERTDFGRDPRRLDTAFIASGAAAGGAPWDEASDPERRRQFWTWWLDRAREAGE